MTPPHVTPHKVPRVSASTANARQGKVSAQIAYKGGGGWSDDDEAGEESLRVSIAAISEPQPPSPQELGKEFDRVFLNWRRLDCTQDWYECDNFPSHMQPNITQKSVGVEGDGVSKETGKEGGGGGKEKEGAGGVTGVVAVEGAMEEGGGATVGVDSVNSQVVFFQSQVIYRRKILGPLPLRDSDRKKFPGLYWTCLST